MTTKERERMKKTTKAALALLLAAGAAFTGGTTAQAATWLCAVPEKVADGFRHRVNLDQTSGYHYATSSSAAAYILGNPDSRTGYRQAWGSDGGPCAKWITVDYDHSTRY
jgi:hypothetical protein